MRKNNKGITLVALIITIIILLILTGVTTKIILDSKFLDNAKSTVAKANNETENQITLENNTENHKVTQKTIKFTLGKAITEAKCSDFGEYVTDGGTVTKNSDGTSTLTCTFDKNGSTDTGNNFQIGSLVVTVKKDSADEDCSIGYESGNSTGTKNPETGASLPLTIVAIGLAVGTGVYFGTKKRTKLYKI